MKNFKLVKTTAALALGASVVTAAVVPGATTASAASKYKVSNGQLVNAKTGKVVKGYVVFKSKLYYNGKLKKGYKTVGSGKTIKLYYNGSLKKGYKTANNKKLLFFNGSLKKGYKTAGEGERLYKDGYLDKGYEVYGDVDKDPSLYYNGYLKSGYKTANNATLLFYNGKLKEGYKTASNETRLYKDGRIPKGLVKADVNKKFYNDGKLATGEFEYEGKKITLKDGVEVSLNIESVSAINAKSLEVKFNNAAIEVKESDFSVKKGTVTSNVAKVTIAEDRKSATIELSSKLTAGDYTVSVKNGEDTLTGTVTAADEKLDKIEILSDVAPMNDNATPTSATVGVQVFNQYGEDITKTAASALTVTATGASVDTGTITITNGAAPIPLKSTAKDGDKFVLTVVDSATGKAASKTVTLSSQAIAADVTVGTLYNVDGKKLTQDTDTATDLFYLPITVKDQYGNAITKTTDIAKGSLVIAGVNTTIASVGNLTSIKIDGKDTLALPVTITDKSFAGTTPVNVVVAATGKSSLGSVTVEAGKSIANVSLGSPTNAVVAQKEDIKFPLTVTDNAGNEVKTLKELKALKAGRGLVKATLDNVKEIDGALYYVVNAGTAPTVTAVAQTENGKVATQTVVVKAAAKVATIVGLSKETDKTLPTSLRADDTTGVGYTKANFVFEDQYGRTIASDSALLDNVTVVASSADAKNSPFDLTAAGSIKVKSSLTDITATSDVITFTAKDGADTIKGSDLEKKFTIVKSSEFASYSVADVKTVSVKRTGTDAYAYQGKDYPTDSIVVYGATKTGEKAKLSASEYSVSGLKGNGSTLSLKDADFKDANGKDVTEKTVNVVVTINATGEKITVPVTYSVADLTTQKVTAYDKVTGKVASKLTVGIPTTGEALTTTVLLGALNFITEDQYGVESEALTAADDVTFTVVSGTPTFASNGTKDAKVASAKDGDVVKATVTVDGKSTSVEITFDKSIEVSTPQKN